MALVLLATALVAGYLWLLRGLPSPSGVASARLAPSTVIYDRQGRVLYEILDPNVGRHQPVALDAIPLWLRQATVSTEDATFFTNPGVDLRAILRAIWINLQGGEVLSGGSTITQQVARNLLLSPTERAPRTLRRKLREAILAYRLARTLSKDEILELYLNQTYYGNLAYGVGAAARSYFGKSVVDLDLSECALLAGLPQAPAVYDPLVNPDAARARQSVVLGLMVRQGLLSDAEAERAANEPLHFAALSFPIRAPHFVMYVWEQIRQQFGEELIYTRGLRVYTTLDVDLLDRAQDIVDYHLTQLSLPSIDEPAHNVSDAAVVAIDPRSGEILAMLGSADYFDARIDGAVNVALMPRQPGSAIKPVTYAAAFSLNPDWTPATMLLDVFTTFTTRDGETYVPVNYDRIYRGPVLLRQALAQSLNMVAVKVLDHIGVPALVTQARQMGINSLENPQRYGLALTLGGGEVRLLELTAAYAAFASGGLRVDPVAIRRIEDASGALVWENAAPAPQRVLDERIAFWITDILSDNAARLPAFGEESILTLTRPAAAKTGTTTDWRDNWTVGYTPQLVVGVWAGNADNTPMVDVSGITGAAPIWHDMMEEALKSQPMADFVAPHGMAKMEVCAVSGLLPGTWCPRRQEWFISGQGPEAICTMHRLVPVDRRTGDLALADTPEEHLSWQVAVFLPEEAADWASDQLREVGARYFIDAREHTGGSSAVSAPGVTINRPYAGATYRLNHTVPLDSQRIEILAAATGDVALVRFYVDDALLVELPAPPYSTLWQLQAGHHSFLAVMFDRSGQAYTSQSVSISVVQ